MRMNLKVPFAEKDAAKKLGAKWDAARKVWFVDNKTDLAPFAQWSPTPHDSAGGVVQKVTVARQEASGKVFVGRDYLAQQRVCDCLPWDDCERCRSTALNAPGR